MSRNTSRNRRKKQIAMTRAIASARRQKRQIMPAIAVILVAVIILSVALYEIYLSPGGLPGGGAQYTYPSSVAGFSKVASSPDRLEGKITVLYIGSMACSHCAEMSWSIYSSLESSGGSWSGLSYIYSNATDSYPDTPGLSFANASYSSSTVAFSGYEISNGNWQPYQSLNSMDQALFSRYDSSQGIPFILIGGMYLHIGDFYPPSVLKNTSGSTIMLWLSHDTTNAITDNIQNASANITSVITELENHPATQFLALHVLNISDIVPVNLRSIGLCWHPIITHHAG